MATSRTSQLAQAQSYLLDVVGYIRYRVEVGLCVSERTCFSTAQIDRQNTPDDVVVLFDVWGKPYIYNKVLSHSICQCSPIVLKEHPYISIYCQFV